MVGEDDGQHRLPFVRAGEEVAGIAEAVIIASLRSPQFTGSLQGSAEVSVMFRKGTLKQV